MTSTADKVEYVRGQRQTRKHHCHWPGCDRQVPPALWGCLPHWRKLPKDLQREIWRTFQPGQERTMTPSRAYVAAAEKVRAWILTNHPPAPAQGRLL
jgi:hypothetical protein